MSRRAGIEISTRLDASQEEVWRRVVTPEGINDELMPLMRMTVPRGVDTIDLDAIEVGRPIGRSWILLGGLLPVDFDEINIVELEPGARFVERSRMLSQSFWQHIRSVRGNGESSVVTDRIAWEPRLPVPGASLRPMFRAIFRHRHRRLRRHFGGDESVWGSPDPDGD
jgi:ligand-binding SRPBCC domain-containing protein